MTDPTWYYAIDGQRSGPVPFEQLQQLVAQRRLGARDLVWREGMPDWQSPATVPGLQPPPPATAAPQQQPRAAQRRAPQLPLAPAAPPIAYGGYEDRRNPDYWSAPVGPSHQGLAIAGFALSLTFFPLGFIFSIMALRGMKRTGNNEGRGLAIAGLVISSVFVALTVLWLIGVAICLTGLHG